MLERVFVFGTLKEGFPNFAANLGRRIGGRFATRERYPLHLVGERHSPWLVDTAGIGEHVVGQVFEVDPAALRTMDRLERIDEPDGYRRRVIEVRDTLDGRLLSVHAYLKDAEQFHGADVRQGPLDEYTLAHAALYRARTADDRMA